MLVAWQRYDFKCMGFSSSKSFSKSIIAVVLIAHPRLAYVLVNGFQILRVFSRGVCSEKDGTRGVAGPSCFLALICLCTDLHVRLILSFKLCQ